VKFGRQTVKFVGLGTKVLARPPQVHTAGAQHKTIDKEKLSRQPQSWSTRKDYILNFRSLTAPLYKLSDKEQDWEWNEACAVAFQELKSRFSLRLKLRPFDPDLPTRIKTRCAGVKEAADLYQHHPKGNYWAPTARYRRK